MKNLYLLRHCKSDWSAAFQRDFDRPLNERGLNEAPLMCSFLSAVTDFSETHVVSSPAVRTRQTLDPLLGRWPDTQKQAVDWNENLYESGLDAYLKVIREVPGAAENLLLVGHNPSIQHVVEYLVSGHQSDELVHVSTGTLLCLSMDVRHWKQATADSAIIKWMITPKLLKKARNI